jgi:hypothetical protein
VKPPLAGDYLPDDDELHDRRAGADGQRRLADLVAGVAGLLELQRFEPDFLQPELLRGRRLIASRPLTKGPSGGSAIPSGV